MARQPRTTEETPEAAAPDLAAQIAELRRELSGIVEALAHEASNRSATFAEKMGAEAEHLKTEAEAAAAAARARLDAQAEEARACVRANPLTAIGIAAVAGLIFGLIFGRR
jgi:ElaB/YqjD/DUF883 family membrane-anchored ribosome-binding protein